MFGATERDLTGLRFEFSVQYYKTGFVPRSPSRKSRLCCRISSSTNREAKTGQKKVHFEQRLSALPIWLGSIYVLNFLRAFSTLVNEETHAGSSDDILPFPLSYSCSMITVYCMSSIVYFNATTQWVHLVIMVSSFYFKLFSTDYSLSKTLLLQDKTGQEIL